MSSAFIHPHKTNAASNLAIETEGAFAQTFLLASVMMFMALILFYVNFRGKVWTSFDPADLK